MKYCACLQVKLFLAKTWVFIKKWAKYWYCIFSRKLENRNWVFPITSGWENQFQFSNFLEEAFSDITVISQQISSLWKYNIFHHQRIHFPNKEIKSPNGIPAIFSIFLKTNLPLKTRFFAFFWNKVYNCSRQNVTFLLYVTSDFQLANF